MSLSREAAKACDMRIERGTLKAKNRKASDVEKFIEKVDELSTETEQQIVELSYKVAVLEKELGETKLRLHASLVRLEHSKAGISREVSEQILLGCDHPATARSDQDGQLPAKAITQQST